MSIIIIYNPPISCSDKLAAVVLCASGADIVRERFKFVWWQPFNGLCHTSLLRLLTTTWSALCIGATSALRRAAVNTLFINNNRTSSSSIYRLQHYWCLDDEGSRYDSRTGSGVANWNINHWDNTHVARVWSLATIAYLYSFLCCCDQLNSTRPLFRFQDIVLKLHSRLCLDTPWQGSQNSILVTDNFEIEIKQKPLETMNVWRNQWLTQPAANLVVAPQKYTSTCQPQIVTSHLIVCKSWPFWRPIRTWFG